MTQVSEKAVEQALKSPNEPVASARVLKGVRNGEQKILAIVEKRDPLTSPIGTTETTRANSSDPWGSSSLELEPLTPPYDPMNMIQLCEESVSLGSCIEAMEVNISGLPARLVSLSSWQGEELEEAESEKLWIKNRLGRLNRSGSLTALRRDIRRNMEKTGNAYVEVIRHAASGRILRLNHIDSFQMRLTPQEEQFTVRRDLFPEQMPDKTMEYLEISDLYRFRRYVQAVTTSSSSGFSTQKNPYGYIYFKEFGDPRVMEKKTGRYLSEEEVQNYNGTGLPMPEYAKATEIFHFGKSDRSPYGIPRWVTATMAVLGTRSAESANKNTVDNNGVPSVAITATGGRLTDGSLQRIAQFVETHAAGNANYSTMLVLEAESEYETDEANSARISIQPLADSQVREMLFKEYIESSDSRVEQSFRIPPLFLGKVGSYNKSTAEISRRITDEQVFAPERDEEDWFFNNVVFANWGVKYWKFVTITPSITDDSLIIQMVTALERTGAMTPSLARTIAGRAIGEVLDYDAEFERIDADTPYSYQLAEAVKNERNSSEPNQFGPPVLPPEGGVTDPDPQQSEVLD